MVFGIVWIAWIGSVAAIVLGHISLMRINRSEGREKGQGFAIAGLVLGYGALAVFVVLVAINVATQGDDEQEPVAETAAPLLPGRQLSLSGIMDDVVEFIETDDGRSVFFEGEGDVSITFGTSGGPASGTFTVSMSGTDNENNTYVVEYTGVLDGTYLPEAGRFEGTVVITGDTPPGFEEAIPDATIWDGGVVVSSDGCAESGIECAFGATKPDVDLYWEMLLPLDAIDPAYLARLD